MAQRKKWSEEEKALLTDMHRKGIPQREMASKLGRSAYSVFCKLHELGLTNRRLNNVQSRTPEIFDSQRAALSALEQAMNQIVKSKDQHNVYIS